MQDLQSITGTTAPSSATAPTASTAATNTSSPAMASTATTVVSLAPISVARPPLPDLAVETILKIAEFAGLKGTLVMAGNIKDWRPACHDTYFNVTIIDTAQMTENQWLKWTDLHSDTRKAMRRLVILPEPGSDVKLVDRFYGSIIHGPACDSMDLFIAPYERIPAHTTFDLHRRFPKLRTMALRWDQRFGILKSYPLSARQRVFTRSPSPSEEQSAAENQSLTKPQPYGVIGIPSGASVTHLQLEISGMNIAQPWLGQIFKELPALTHLKIFGRSEDATWCGRPISDCMTEQLLSTLFQDNIASGKGLHLEELYMSGLNFTRIAARSLHRGVDASKLKRVEVKGCQNPCLALGYRSDRNAFSSIQELVIKLPVPPMAPSEYDDDEQEDDQYWEEPMNSSDILAASLQSFTSLTMLEIYMGRSFGISASRLLSLTDSMSNLRALRIKGRRSDLEEDKTYADQVFAMSSALPLLEELEIVFLATKGSLSLDGKPYAESSPEVAELGRFMRLKYIGIVIPYHRWSRPEEDLTRGAKNIAASVMQKNPSLRVICLRNPRIKYGYKDLIFTIDRPNNETLPVVTQVTFTEARLQYPDLRLIDDDILGNPGSGEIYRVKDIGKLRIHDLLTGQ